MSVLAFFLGVLVGGFGMLFVISICQAAGRQDKAMGAK